MVEHQLRHPNQVNERGCIVITRDKWRDRGVTAVHCDQDGLELKLATCDQIPVDQLNMLAGIPDGDEHFDFVRKCFDVVGGNNGPDNQDDTALLAEL